FLLEKLLNEPQQGSTLRRYPGMPTPSRNWGAEVENPYISEQLDYNPPDERQAAELQVAQLNPEQ
ncbi:uncharacterized protein TRAVEDRAFT_81321, partial [Trametes versicolor FP-101664 SS1]|uniref:uncharacterized protein n=1 Tax=Trametes versicolor (strain FP-101664) TaxID=717944 RepID=UPI0004621296